MRNFSKTKRILAAMMAGALALVAVVFTPLLSFANLNSDTKTSEENVGMCLICFHHPCICEDRTVPEIAGFCLVCMSSPCVCPKVKHNTNNIPQDVIQSFKPPKGAVSRAHFAVDDITSATDITVRYDKQRAGMSTTLHRHDPSTDSLDEVAKTIIDEDGKATYQGLTAGGDFMAVIHY